MTKIIKGKGKDGDSDSSFIIQGTEWCTPSELGHLRPLIKELGFTKVTSHDDYLTIGIGNGANTLTMHHTPAGNISAGSWTQLLEGSSQDPQL